ncbi:MAG: ParB N-terminal domain-containing protein [Akkermansiaceae bacterium]|nr:ParB N-terminal domain-containing protein [Akkermansiaceae bacterium]
MKLPHFAFELEQITVPIDHILPVRVLKEPEKKFKRYLDIISTIRESRLIEPLMVFPQKGIPNRYLLTDGHLRLAACRELGVKEVNCIVSLDDESYTYNAKVNRLAPIQERRMILKAVENGVSMEKIAAALNVDVKKIKDRLKVTAGLCDHAVEILKDKQMSPTALKLLSKVVPSRQIEIAELMLSAHNFSVVYVEALLLCTPKDKLSSKGKVQRKIKPEELARMEIEMDTLEKEYKNCEQVFSSKMLVLTVLRRYVLRLLKNEKVDRFLSARHSGIHEELTAIVANETVC